MDKPRIIIAGPGAGKTFNLTNEILSCLADFDGSRFCAVVTYTNAVTEELRTRISTEMPIPPNVFIGTIHGFLIRFIIEPYLHLIKNGPMKKNYIEGPRVELPENYGVVTLKALKNRTGVNNAEAKEVLAELKQKRFCSVKGAMTKACRLYDTDFRLGLCNKYAAMENEIIETMKGCVLQSEARISVVKARATYLAEELSKYGIISYDTVIGISSQIIKNNPSILDTFPNRLQFLFVDEYQDSRLHVHNIFEAILSKKSTKICFFGDPLQAVFMFSYNTSHLKSERPPETFNNTPMKELQAKYPEKLEPKNVNHRSSEEIVTFINRYILEDQYKQTSRAGSNGIPIYLIDSEVPTKISEIYERLKTNHCIDEIHKASVKKSRKSLLKDFLLTRDWIDKDNNHKPKFKGVYDAFKGSMSRLEKGNHRVNGILHEISRCVLAIAGVNKAEFVKSTVDELEYRKFCFTIARDLRSRTFNGYDHRVNFIRMKFREKFGIISDNGLKVDIENPLSELANQPSFLAFNPESCFSSIHSAKGLEATSVLAIAYSSNELEKWLNFQKANNSGDDDYRLGYVAFSRARDMLCIGCLGTLSEEIRTKLKKTLNLTFVTS